MATNDTLKIAGLKLKIDGAAEFNKTLEQLNLEFKKSGAELSKVTAEYGNSSQAIEVLSARHTDLSNKISTQHKTTERLKEVLAQVARQFDENSIEAEKLRVKIIESEAAEIRLQTSLDAVTVSISENQKAQESLGNETEDFAKTIKLLNMEIDKSNAELSKVTAEYGKDGQAIEVLTAKHKNLESTLASQGKITEAYNRALMEAAKQHGENSEAVGELQVKISKSEAIEIGYRKSLEETTVAIAENQKAQENANITVDEATEKIKQHNEQLKLTAQEMQKTGEAISKWGKEVQGVGKGLTTHITAPLMAIGGLASKASVDFESAFADVRKTVDTTEEGYNKLSEAIRKLSTKIPASAEAISQVAANAGQLGIAEENVMSFTRTMIDLGESTNLSADTASTTLAKLANITQMSQRDFDRLGSTIVALGNNFATSESAIAAMGMRLAGAGANVGMTQAQIMALAAAFSSMGIEAEAGGSSISKVIANMQIAVEKGGDKLKQFASIAGMSTEQFAKAFREDAAGALTAFIVGLGNLKEQGESTIIKLDEMGLSEARVRDALLRVSGANEILTESLALSNAEWEENTALSNEAAERNKTTAGQFQILENNIAEAARSLGDGFLPFLNKLLDMSKPTIEGIKGAAEEFKNLSEGQQEAIIKTGLFVAAIGPAIYGIGGAVKTVGEVKTMLGKFKEALYVVEAGATASSSAVGGLASAINILKGPVGWITLGLGAAIAGWSLYQSAQDSARQEIIETAKELRQLRTEIESSTEKISNIDELAKQWENLNAIISNTSDYDKLKNAKEELAIVEQKLIDLSDGLITSYSIQNGSVSEQIASIKELTEAERELAILKLQQKLNDTDISKIEKDTEALVKKQAELQNTANMQLESYATLRALELEYKQVVDDATLSAHERSKAIESINSRADEARKSFGGLVKDVRLLGVSADEANDALGETNLALEKNITKQTENEAAINSYREEAALLEDLKLDMIINKNTNAAINNTGATNDNTDALSGNISTGEYQIKTLEQLQEEQEKLNKTISNTITELDGLNKVYSETSKEQELNSSQLLDMIDKYPLVAEYINLTGDATLNNGEIIKQVAEIRKQDLINTLELRKQDLESELTTARAKLDIVSQEYAGKARIAQAYYSAYNNTALANADADLKAAAEAYDTISKSLSGVEAQLKVVNKITLTTGDSGKESGDKTAKALSKAADKAEALAIKTSETNDKLKEAADSTQEYYESALEASNKAVEESKDSTIKAVTDSAKKSKEAMQEVLQHKEKIAELSSKINELMLQEQTKTTEAEIKRLTKELDETVKLAEKASETAVKEAAKTTEEIVRANEDALKLLGNGLTDALKSSYDEMNNDQQEFIDRQLDLVKEGTYKEVQLSKDASVEKIQVWDDEYYARLRQIDGLTDAYIDSVREQISAELTAIAERDAKISGNIAIQNAKSEETKREMERLKDERELKQHQERLKELDEAISSAKTDEDRSRATKRKQDYLDDIAYQTELKRLQDEYNTSLEETQKLKKEQAENIKQGQESIKKIETDNIKEMETLLKALKDGWGDYYDSLSEDADMLAAEMIKDFENNQELIISLLNAYNPKWREEGKSFIDYFQEGIDSGEIDIAELVKNIDKAINENKPEESLSDLVMIDNDELDENIKEAAKTIESNQDEMKKSSQKLADAAKLPLENFKKDTYRLGQDAAQGYVDGLLSKLEQAKSAAALIAEASQTSIATTNDSHSPSRVTRKLGNDFGDGYMLGMQERLAGIRHISSLLAEASIVNLEPSHAAYKGSANGSAYETQEGRGQINIEVNVNVAKLDATNKRDAQALGEQLAFGIKQKLIGTGDA